MKSWANSVPAMIPGCCWGDAMKAEKPQEIRRELLSTWQWQKAWCQAGHWKGDSSSNMSCRQARGNSGKEEQLSGEPWIFFTPLVPVASPNAWDRDDTQCSLSSLFGSSSSSVALKRISPRVHPTYFVRVINSLLMPFPQVSQIAVQMQVKWGDMKNGGCEAESDIQSPSELLQHRVTLIISAFAQVCITFLLFLPFSPGNCAGKFQAYVLLEFTQCALSKSAMKALTFLYV